MKDAPARGGMNRRNALALIGAAVPLSACGMMREPQTELTFTVTADGTINPNEDTEASPVLVRVYELKSPTAFQQATLFELLDDDQGKLGADLVARREIEIKPNDTEEFERETAADTRYIGVVAAFRNIDTATWRGTTQIEPRGDNRIQIIVSGTTVQIDSRRVRFGII